MIGNFLRAQMFDDRGDVVIRRIDLLGDMDHLSRQLARCPR
jgi:hypothetical protein